MTREVLDQIKAEIEKDMRIEFAILHGSYLEQQSYHDIDLAIYLETSFSADIVEYYEVDFAATLTSKIKLDIDIAILNTSALGFKFQTLKGERIFCRDVEIYFTFAEEVQRDYHDFQLLRNQMLEEV